MRLAFLADIHGNLPALEAVIADLDRQHVDGVYLVGDQINRCPWHNEVLDLLEDRGWPAIFGNHEYIIARIRTAENIPPFTNHSRFPTLWWTQSKLTEHHLAALRNLPAERNIDIDNLPSVYLTHGIPGNCSRGIFPEDADERIAAILTGVSQSYVVCAHTHRPLDRTVGRWRILNPGSVGMPYNGDRRAQYLLLEAYHHDWQPRFRAVDYDWAALEQAFATSKMVEEIGPEAELHLRTALTGLPWSSDFSYWLGLQAHEVQQDLAAAVSRYLTEYGPSNWFFR